MPFGKGMDTVFEFAIPNRERMVVTYRSWVRAIPYDVYRICRPSRNQASPRSEISNAVFRSLMSVVRWGLSVENIAMSST